MKPLVSVILPFYNAEDTLARAVKSITDQSFSDFELLLVDNNSSSESITAAKKIASGDKRIRILQEKRQGVDFAMNCGLENAKGKYIARMDADDVAYPQRLGKQVEFLENNDEYGLVGSRVSYVPHNDNTKGFKRFINWVNAFCSSSEIERYRFIEIPVVNPTIMFRRALYKEYGGCRNGDFPEDYEMLLRFLDGGVRMAKLPEPLLEWHDYNGRLTRSDKRYSSEAFFRVKAEYFSKWSVQNNIVHPCVWVWGAGRKTRQRASLLEKNGIRIEGYIDVVKNKTALKSTIHFSEIPHPGNVFIIAMVGNYGARDQIRQHLEKINYREGHDYIVMA